MSGLPEVVRKDIKNLHLGCIPRTEGGGAPRAVGDDAVRLAVIRKLRGSGASRRSSRPSSASRPARW